MTNLTRRHALGLLAALPAAARAEGAWPDRPMRIVVGYPAGGPTDFPARLLQDPLSQLWSQPIVIENRPGASSVLATEVVAKSAPDGYTLLMGASVHASNPAVYPRLPYDSLRDFTPIVNIYGSPTMILTAADSPWRNPRDMLAAMKAQPGMTYATSGNGSSGQFAGETFAQKFGVELTHVAYRGAAPAFQDVITGRVPITFATLSGALPLARDGKLKAIAVAAPQRVAVLPNVPTLAEFGLDVPDTSPWYGLIGPAGIPQAVALKIAADVQVLLRRPAIAQRILDQGGVLIAEGPDVFAARIRREMAETAEVARRAHIRSE